jgi:hypothetical protein
MHTARDFWSCMKKLRSSVETTNGRVFVGDYVCLHHDVNQKNGKCIAIYKTGNSIFLKIHIMMKFTALSIELKA